MLLLEEVVTRLGQQYIGQNVDVLVVRFGPPASTFKMNSGDTSYVWQLGNQTNINTDRGSGIANTLYCKVSVVASKTGIISQLNTEDSNAGGGLAGAMGMYGSICANRLGIERQSFVPQRSLPALSKTRSTKTRIRPFPGATLLRGQNSKEMFRCP